MDKSKWSPVLKKLKIKMKLPKKKGFMDYFKDYCEYTGIHGFIYIGEERTILERYVNIFRSHKTSFVAI